MTSASIDLFTDVPCRVLIVCTLSCITCVTGVRESVVCFITDLLLHLPIVSALCIEHFGVMMYLLPGSCDVITCNCRLACSLCVHIDVHVFHTCLFTLILLCLLNIVLVSLESFESVGMLVNVVSGVHCVFC